MAMDQRPLKTLGALSLSELVDTDASKKGAWLISWSISICTVNTSLQLHNHLQSYHLSSFQIEFTLTGISSTEFDPSDKSSCHCQSEPPVFLLQRPGVAC